MPVDNKEPIPRNIKEITQEDLDLLLESMWETLEDVPCEENEKGELILAVDWECFKAGTEREDIWHWFDERHSKGVAYLLNEFEG